MNSVILKRFDAPDELRSFEKGTFALVHLGGMTIGQATYEPGWKWSTHVGPVAGTATCQVAHVGMVVSGRAAVAMEDGTIYELAPGVSLLLRLGMIAGSSGRNPMCPSISLGQKTMPAKAGSNRQICPGHGLFGPSAQFRPARLPLPPRATATGEHSLYREQPPGRPQGYARTIHVFGNHHARRGFVGCCSYHLRRPAGEAMAEDPLMVRLLTADQQGGQRGATGRF